MNRLAPLVLLCALAAATPAGAQTPRKLTVHQAKHAIKRNYLFLTPDTPARNVTIGNCHRHGPQNIRCRLIDQTRPGCYLSQFWDASGPPRDVEALTALNMHDRAWGDCPDSFWVAPVDGQPTYLPPG